jgi:flagellar biosynthesis protein FlhF
MTLPRTYRASRFEDAVALAKRDLGPDAMIVGTRELGGGRGGGRASVELLAIAAGDSSHGSASRSLPTSISDTDEAAGAPERRSGLVLEHQLVRRGVPAAAARELAARVRGRLGREPSDALEATASLAPVLRERMIFAPSGLRETRVVALVGPTGVGKTTTVAKLAAHASLVEGRRVALVGMDHYRVGAAEQLEHYADLVGVPVRHAWDGPSLSAALAELGWADLVLVDTEGRAPSDKIAIARLGEAFETAGEPIFVHLCLAAATRQCDLERAITRLAPLSPVRLTVTKVDEAIEAGGIVGAHVASGLPLAWLTTGQRVPEDIEVASAERLSSLLCGEEVEA